MTVLGGLLRVYRYDVLSLWIDEGYTVLFSRLPWDSVLGLHGAADPSHPPGYYAAVAALRLLVPDLIAGRLLSVVAGTLTIPALYALARRLLAPGAALLASLVLALAPLHYWYSQEACPYAVTELAVVLSYLALVVLGQGGGRRAVVGYIAATVIALYLDYSAAYALLPQGVIFGYLAWSDRSCVRRLLTAGSGVVLGYLPWLPQALTGAGLHTFYQPAFLMPTPDQIGDAALALTGVSFRSSYNPALPPAGLWDLGLAGQVTALLLVTLIVALGAVGLRRAGGLAALVAVSLALGTPLVAATISLISPGFASRTVLPAGLGWALLVGGLATSRPATDLLQRYRRLGWGAAGVALALALATLGGLLRDGDKQHWRALAADMTVAARFNGPILVVRPVAYTLLDLYAPGVLATRAISDVSELPTDHPPAMVWFASHDSLRFDVYRQALADRGYVRAMQVNYPQPLVLELYRRSDASLGNLVPGLDTASALPLTRRLPAQSGGLYLLAGEMRATAHAGLVTAALRCLPQAADPAAQAQSSSVPPDNQWYALRLGTLCPAGTTGVEVRLDQTAAGAAAFRKLRLRTAQP